MLQRFVRLWPFAFIGVVLGLLIMTARLIVEGHPELLWRALPTALLNGLFLPSPFLPMGNASAWPLNLPLWSLTFELAANLAYAVMLVHARGRAFLALTALAAVAYVTMAYRLGTADVGWRLHDLHWGFVRVLFPFMAGVVVYRTLATRQHRLGGGPWAIVFSAAFLAAICGPRADGAAYTALFALVLTPAFIFAGAQVAVPVRLRFACRLLGDLSFPVYIVHQPLLHLPSLIHRLTAPAWWPHLLAQAAAAAGAIAVAYLLMKRVEPRLRAQVARWVAAKASPRAAATVQRP